MIMSLYHNDKPVGVVAGNSTQYDRLLAVVKRHGDSVLQAFTRNGYGDADEVSKAVDQILSSPNNYVARDKSNVLLTLRKLLKKTSGLVVLVME